MIVIVVVAVATVTVAAAVMTRRVYRRASALAAVNVDEVSAIGELEWDETSI